LRVLSAERAYSSTGCWGRQDLTHAAISSAFTGEPLAHGYAYTYDTWRFRIFPRRIVHIFRGRTNVRTYRHCERRLRCCRICNVAIDQAGRAVQECLVIAACLSVSGQRIILGFHFVSNPASHSVIYQH